MNLVKINPKKNNTLMPGFNDVFSTIFDDTFFNDSMMAKVPATNISESHDQYHIELAAPGLKKDDFKLNLQRNSLTISVENISKEGAEDRGYSKREFSYNSFVRSFMLPETADQNRIEASYLNGILHIDIAKKEEAKSLVKQIVIK